MLLRQRCPSSFFHTTMSECSYDSDDDKGEVDETDSDLSRSETSELCVKELLDSLIPAASIVSNSLLTTWILSLSPFSHCECSKTIAFCT
jgi:hypothetical protein